MEQGRWDDGKNKESDVDLVSLALAVLDRQVAHGRIEEMIEKDDDGEIRSMMDHGLGPGLGAMLERYVVSPWTWTLLENRAEVIGKWAWVGTCLEVLIGEEE